MYSIWLIALGIAALVLCALAHLILCACSRRYWYARCAIAHRWRALTTESRTLREDQHFTRQKHRSQLVLTFLIGLTFGAYGIATLIDWEQHLHPPTHLKTVYETPRR